MSTQKNKISVYIGDNPTLSRAIQTVAFPHGFEWPFWRVNIAQNVNRKVLTFNKDDKVIAWHPLRLQIDPACDFDASTDFYRIIEWLSKPLGQHKDEKIKQLEVKVAELQQQAKADEDDIVRLTASALKNVIQNRVEPDDFPTPELTPKERKQIFLEGFVKYLNHCKEVRFEAKGQFGICVSYYGKISGGAEKFGLRGGVIVFDDNSTYPLEATIISIVER